MISTFLHFSLCYMFFSFEEGRGQSKSWPKWVWPKLVMAEQFDPHFGLVVGILGFRFQVFGSRSGLGGVWVVLRWRLGVARGIRPFHVFTSDLSR